MGVANGRDAHCDYERSESGDEPADEAGGDGSGWLVDQLCIDACFMDIPGAGISVCFGYLGVKANTAPLLGFVTMSLAVVGTILTAGVALFPL